MFDALWLHGLQHTRSVCPSLSPTICSNSCSLSWWCHPIFSSSVVLFSSCPQSFPASGSFPMSQFFTSSGGQSIGVSASASILLMNIQDWFPLGLTGLISLESKGLSRVFSNTTAQKPSIFLHSAFFMVQLSHSYMTTGKARMSSVHICNPRTSSEHICYHRHGRCSMPSMEKSRWCIWIASRMLSWNAQ